MGLFKKSSKNSQLKERTIVLNHCGNDEAVKEKKTFCDNKVVTAHYTWWNFLPVNIYEQFHIIANFFFLLISIMYFFGDTPINPATTIAPLVAVVSISILKDAYDDMKRHKEDRSFNRTSFHILRLDHASNTLKWESRFSEEIRCGDVIACEEGHFFPCDMVLLSSCHSNGKVFITTDNLDGESAIKTTNTVHCTQIPFASALTDLEAGKMNNIMVDFPSAAIICQDPSEDLKSFQGRLVYGDESVPISIENVVLRGANLRHTSHTIGVAVYTGKDTKLSLNSKPGTRKFSSSSRRFNVILLIFMVFLFLTTLVCTLLQFAWRATDAGSPWYLNFPRITPWTSVQEFLTLLFIVNYLIPISIMVTMELQQLVLALYISKDIEFYDPKSNEKGQFNATNIADELGQIEFLFSDKTGTLTQNQMAFKCYGLVDDNSVYNIEDDGLFMVRDSQKITNIYGAEKTDLSAPQEVKATDYLSSSSEDEDEEEEDEDIDKTGRRRSQFKFQVSRLSESAEAFWTVAALCHTVEATVTKADATTAQQIVYNASLTLFSLL